MIALDQSTFKPEQLASGDSYTIVAVDFQGTTGEKTLGEQLASGSHDGVAVYQIDPARDMGLELGKGTTVPDLDAIAAAYSDALTGQTLGARVAVAGNCSAGTLTLRIASRLSDRGRAAAVLLRPTWPDLEMIGGQFANLRAGLHADEDAPVPALGGEPSRALEDALQVLRSDARSMAVESGISPDGRVVQELLVRYRGWLGFLLATRRALLSQWADELELHVYTDPGMTADVPWFPAGSYEVKHLNTPDDDSWLSDLLA